MQLNLKSIQNREWWRERGIALPEYDLSAMRARTRANPTWIHFGAGNLFRAYIARMSDALLNAGLAECGIIAVDTSDGALARRVYRPHDLLSLAVTLHSDGRADRAVLGSIAEIAEKTDWNRLAQIFRAPSLQMVSLTITEKGYAPDGIPGLLAQLLLERFRAGALPIALVSMDNCSQNGEKLKSAVLAAADPDPAFRDYLENRVAFPWTMIDKITPRPDERMLESLSALGVEGMDILSREHGAPIAPFVNAESAEYLVIEDSFPNGRPPLERAGALMTDCETVRLCERMKVTACLNPLHTAMAVLGCALGYHLICDEMADFELVSLIRTIGREGLRFVQKPGVLNPEQFLENLICERLPNPYIPDTPQRIACDTSQKVPIRYGATIRAWHERGEEGALTGVAIAIAGWLRYLLGVDDSLEPFAPSPDPRLNELQAHLANVKIGAPVPENALDAILADRSLFPIDLTQSPLGAKIRRYFEKMCAGRGAIRKTIRWALNGEQGALERLHASGVVPVVVLDRAEDAVPVARAMLAGGITVMEITFRTDAAEESIRRVALECPEMLVGAGTVITQAQCSRAIDAGAQFIVSPGLDPEVAALCAERQIPITPGCVTPTEIMQALKLGVQVIKFFPASVYGGVSAMKALSAPFSGVKFIPTGGVDAGNLAEYLAKPFVHAVGGSWLCPKKEIAAGNYIQITRLCREATEIVRAARNE